MRRIRIVAVDVMDLNVFTRLGTDAADVIVFEQYLDSGLLWNGNAHVSRYFLKDVRTPKMRPIKASTSVKRLAQYSNQPSAPL